MKENFGHEHLLSFWSISPKDLFQQLATSYDGLKTDEANERLEKFGALIFILHTTTHQFRTGWFLESVISASMIVLVIRSRRSFLKSKPGNYLLIATLSIVVFTVFFLYSPLSALFGFQPLPLSFLIILGSIAVLYIFSAEIAK